MSNEFYIPSKDSMRTQSTSNKQMSGGLLEKIESNSLHLIMENFTRMTYSIYESLLESKLSRELSRLILPVCNFTELYWKIDLRNFFHFISLRDDSHAQNEIQSLAQIMYSMVKEKFPVCCQAFEDYQKNAITFSFLELEYIHYILKLFLRTEKDILGIIDKADIELKLEGKEMEEFKSKVEKLIVRDHILK